MPDPVFTLTNSGQSLEQTLDARTRTLEWDAFDPSFTTSDAVKDHPLFPVSLNQEYPLATGTGLYLDRFGIRPRGGRLWRVTAQYTKPASNSSGGHPGEDPDDPLLKKPTIRWTNIMYSEAVDRDSVRPSPNAILNSAGVPVNGANRPFTAKVLSYTRNRPNYDIGLALSFENTVNSDSFQGAAAGEVRCTSILPTQVYSSSATYVEESSEFEFRAIEIWGDHPHQFRFVDKGRMAWANATVNGEAGEHRVTLCDVYGNPLTEDALLGGDGKPWNGSDVTYLDDNGRAVFGPAWVVNPNFPEGLPPGAIKVSIAGGGVYLIYKTIPEKAFSSLNIVL